MLRLNVLLLFSLTCLLMFRTSNLEAVEVMKSSSESRLESDIFCANVLQGKMNTHEALRKMGLSPFPKMDNDIEAFTIEILWNKIPNIRKILQHFAREIHYIKNRSLNEDHNYRGDIIDSILNFIQALSKKVIGEAELIAMITDNPSYFSESQVDLLTNQIQQLEKLIDQLEAMSPVESFIYADIVNEATEYLERINDDDIKEFDLGQYIMAQDYEKRFKQLNLSTILNGTEQRRYLLQQYQLLQRYPNRIAESQSSHSVETEQKDNLRANLNLAQSLRMRSIDPVKTHIPEFADLIGNHLDFIKRGVIDESQKLSDVEKN